MDFVLNEAEARVFGCLIEKQLTTPDYYPLSLNALLNACNQKSNREPVVNYDEQTVLAALSGLKDKGLVLKSDVSRVTKYEERFTKPRNLIRRESSVLSTLLLRGPQTTGEIRSRTERMFDFNNLEAVTMTMTELEEMELVVKLQKSPGRKEARYAHLFSGQPEADSEPASSSVEPESESVSNERDARIAALEETVGTLLKEVNELKQAFTEFRKQFE